MRITLVSDLHLEFSDLDLVNDQNTDLLILAGDIMVAEDLHNHPVSDRLNQARENNIMGLRQANAVRYRDFLARCSYQWPQVLFVAGNHEFYHGRFWNSIEHLREEISAYDNIVFLENQCHTVNDTVFVGATTWTDMNRNNEITKYTVQRSMNDFSLIRNDRKGWRKITADDVIERHRHSVQYIQNIAAQHRDKKVVVVTHHCPSHLSIHEQYKNDREINGAYVSDLSDIMLDNENIVLWCHGHTHHRFDYEIGGCRVVCNPRGYQSDFHSEDTGFDTNFVIEV